MDDGFRENQSSLPQEAMADLLLKVERHPGCLEATAGNA